MLFAGRTESGSELYPKWWVFLFGGTYQQSVDGGYGWRPSLLRMTKKYYDEKWWEAGYSWWGFVAFNRDRGLLSKGKNGKRV